MKKDYNIRTLLGITQQEAAMLLRVGRSQWSMYESGKRDLPLPAKQLLAEMLTYMQAPKETGKQIAIATVHAKDKLDRLLRENEYQQLSLARKMAAMEKKQAANLRLAQLADFLASRQSQSGKGFMPHQMITNRASQSSATNTTGLLLEYELKKEVLVLEKLLLESKLLKITQIPENKENIDELHCDYCIKNVK